MPGQETKKEPKAETAKETPHVQSGMVRNDQTIIGHGGIFNVPVGKGRIITFTLDPLATSITTTLYWFGMH